MRLGRAGIYFVFAALAALTVADAFAQAGKQPPRPTRRPMPKPEWLDPDHTTPSGTSYETFQSKSLGAAVSCLVYLPPDYEQGAKRYPVIYWLHGLGGTQRGAATIFVSRFDVAVRSGSVSPAMVVCVNGMVNSFYNDWVDGTRPVESVIIKDLIPHIDGTYRTVARREGRVIQGYSMGGYGAGHLGFKYPELFGTVIIDAGALFSEMARSTSAMAPIFKGAWGDDVARFKAEHPAQLARKNAERLRGKTKIRIGVGDQDMLLVRNRELHELLDQLEIAHEWELVAGVSHNSAKYYEKLGSQAFAIHCRAFEALAKSP